MSADISGSCGCCQGDEDSRGARPNNPPGVPSLAYRVGTHASFKRAMKESLAAPGPLRALTTREDDDPAIALLDAWASVLDVLTFYQERIANEGYLRTAVERRSILELARSIGYELRPGVAASTHVAFKLDTATEAPKLVTIPVGTKVQSIPKERQTAQIFETVEEIEARPRWNALRPVRAEMKQPALNDPSMVLRETTTKLELGDALLIVGKEREDEKDNDNWDFRRVVRRDEVPDTKEPERANTVIEFDRPLGKMTPPSEPPKESPKLFVLRQRARLFGHNAPQWNTLPVALRVGEKDPASSILDGAFKDKKDEWVEASLPKDTTHINLDAVYPRIVAQSWIVLSQQGAVELFKVEEVKEEGCAGFLLAASTTRLKIKGENIDRFSRREAVVFAVSEQMELKPTPIGDPVAGDEIRLEGAVDGLEPGQLLLVEGTDKATEKPAAEIAVVRTSDVQEQVTVVALTADLTRAYLRPTVTINANVAPATHGETRVDEVLGSGDAGQPFQSFALKAMPLTFVSAPTPSGTKSTLEIRVNGLLWEETRSFYGMQPGDHVYRLRLTDDASPIVTIGDGRHGARTPSGIENVRARRYRVGIGTGGLLDAGQLSLLLNRPLGVKEASNPFPTSGAADPERTDEARQNAPLTVLAFDRVVSLQDFEDLARAFAGVAKAQATLLWSGQQRVVHLTVAGPGGAPIPTDSTIDRNLRQAIDRARHVDRGVVVASYRQPEDPELTFDLNAELTVDPRRIPEEVIADAEAALRAAFSFERRSFGQSVASSDVISVLQRTRGVVAVDLNALHLSTQSALPQPLLPVHTARLENGIALPAELLTIRPAGIRFTWIQP